MQAYRLIDLWVLSWQLFTDHTKASMHMCLLQILNTDKIRPLLSAGAELPRCDKRDLIQQRVEMAAFDDIFTEQRSTRHVTISHCNCLITRYANITLMPNQKSPSGAPFSCPDLTGISGSQKKKKPHTQGSHTSASRRAAQAMLVFKEPSHEFVL